MKTFFFNKKMTYLQRIPFFAALVAVMLFPVTGARGTINSITLTPADPTTMSSGVGYYLAGKTYSFSVNVIDPDITGWAGISDVRITIPNSTNIVVSIAPSGTGTDLPVTVVSGTVNAVANVTGTYNNCTITFKVTFRWDTPENLTASTQSVVAQATTTNTRTDTRSVYYGICSSIKILNIAASGTAADGMINPWHDAFNVTGSVVYNVSGAGAADQVHLRADATNAEISNLELYIDGAASGFTDADETDGVSITVNAGTITTLGNRALRVRATMATAGGPETSSNNLTLICDRVEITGITFFNGGGVDSPSYYRSINVPGPSAGQSATQVRITARMQNGLGPMVGNIQVTLENITHGGTTAVNIFNGQTSGVAYLSYPTTLPAADNTNADSYQVSAISGGSYSGDAAGQNSAARVTQVANPVVYWDNVDPPGGASSPFTGWLGFSQTAFSLTFNWTPLASGAPDGDFYTYRLYYKKSAATTWTIVDRNTTGFTSLGTISTGTVTINNLQPVTEYDYYMTAVDVFGQEVIQAYRAPKDPFDTASTIASTVQVSITDGIDAFEDDTFTKDANSSARKLRKTAVRVNMFIVGVEDLPDGVNIIGIPNVMNPATDGNIISSGVIDGALTENVHYYRYSSIKTGSNQWVGYIPDSSPLVAVGANTGFILEMIKGGVKSYADHNSELEAAPGNPNNYEWTFSITSQPTFQPWPTRVLNNVITDANPIAYPAYYLTDNAYVTIKAYDIKGRPVATLLDNVYRAGGQNIKEGGWRGDNRSNRKLGVGLYYLHFQAKRASDGRTILNSFQKVVMAR